MLRHYLVQWFAEKLIKTCCNNVRAMVLSIKLHNDIRDSV